MYQSIIRDPGGNGLIRIQPGVCGQYSAIVNGSILIVPPGTIAFVAINGTLSRPYGPGRYEIFTGVDPFFVRLRNILTHGRHRNHGVCVLCVDGENEVCQARHWRVSFPGASLPSYNESACILQSFLLNLRSSEGSHKIGRKL